MAMSINLDVCLWEKEEPGLCVSVVRAVEVVGAILSRSGRAVTGAACMDVGVDVGVAVVVGIVVGIVRGDVGGVGGGGGVAPLCPDLSGVLRVLVLCGVALLRELLAAEGAAERPVARVDAHMH